MKLAQYTFGMFIEPSDHKNNDDFHNINDPVMKTVDKAPGLIGRSGYADEPGPESWGLQVYPRFYVERGDGWSPSTLTLWENLESTMAFTYSGLHAELFKQGRKWFEKPKWPPLVLWWVEDNHIPTWAEGCERHEFLHDHGPSKYAFGFKKPFDPAGNPTTVDKSHLKSLISKGS